MKFFDRFKSKRKDDEKNESDAEILQAEESESLEAPISDDTLTDSLEPSGFDDSIVTVESGSLSDPHSPISGEFQDD